jgi:hypothetical protein
MRTHLSRKLMLTVFCLTALASALVGCSAAPTSAPTPTPTPTPTPQNQQPVEVVSVSGPLQPINPGGPIVEITLKNVGTEPVVTLAATLELGRSFVFNFEVTPANSLIPGNTISARLTLLGGGFDDTLLYPLTIKGTMPNGDTFTYTRQVMIKPQTPNSPEISLAPIHEVKVSIMKSNPPQIGVHIQGGLRDGCTTFNDIETTQDGNTVNIKVTVQHPVEAVCTEIYGYFEKDVNLGSDFTAGATYTLNVNDYTTTFVYQ